MGQSESYPVLLPSFEGAGIADAEASNHDAGDSSWESVWIDLGGEG